jgi:hypothetical protein
MKPTVYIYIFFVKILFIFISINSCKQNENGYKFCLNQTNCPDIICIPESPDKFSFALSSDQMGVAMWESDLYFSGAIKSLKETNPDIAFIITTGDLRPPDASLNIIKKYLKKTIQWYPVTGNHDAEDTDTMVYLRNYNYDINGTEAPNIVNSRTDWLFGNNLLF